MKKSHVLVNCEIYLFWIFFLQQRCTSKHRSVNQTFIVNKKRGIISEGECPSHNITLHNKSFDTSSRHTLSRFTKYLWITLPFLYHVPNQEGDIYDLISSSDISLVNQALLIFHLHFPNSILTFDPVLSHKIKPASS